ncbi:unnamed protein product [Tuber aestivum]|uniref:Uncharacterized protein n=1 Tax=Tuber aestivum TaxID=59557 RepID=A0A292PI91_9PEZI|nr:unnamed protein product [Tuber aestivum]
MPGRGRSRSTFAHRTQEGSTSRRSLYHRGWLWRELAMTSYEIQRWR